MDEPDPHASKKVRVDFICQLVMGCIAFKQAREGGIAISLIILDNNN